MGWLLHLTSEVTPSGSVPSQVVIFPPGNVELAGEESVLFTPESAAAIIADFKAQGVKMPIDYDHAIPKNAGTGKAAPACGWITNLTYDAARGLVADVEWTTEAADHVKAGRYKYMSPTFWTAGAKRTVTALHSMALTNKPRIKNFPELIAASITADGTNDGDKKMPDDKPTTANMDALKAYMADKGMIPKEATPDQCAEYLLKYMQANMGDGSQLCSVATKLGLDAKADAKLILASIDKLVSDRVPASDYKALKDRIDAMDAADKARVASQLVSETSKAGKLNPNDETAMKWATDFATKDAEGFRLWSAGAPKMWEPGRETAKDGATPPAGTSPTRASIIAAEAREFSTDPVCRRAGFDCEGWVNAALVQKQLPKLSKEELAALPA